MFELGRNNEATAMGKENQHSRFGLKEMKENQYYSKSMRIINLSLKFE